jgi:UDP-2,4-diacetamido-2,4,6-trideoxy-beta-L-altropyranose hydrolase
MREAAVLIRADASPMLGAGHVLRCLALAGPLARRLRVVFVAAHVLPNLAARIAAAGHTVRHLEGVEPGGPRDLAATVAIAREIGASVAVIDGAHFDEAYQDDLRSACGRLVQVGDEAVALGVADVIVNHGLHAAEAVYVTKARPGAIRLLGPRYALIREEFRQARASEEPRTHLLIAMGGSDPAGLTCRLAELLLDADGLPPIVALVGSTAPRLGTLLARAARSQGRLRVCVDEPKVADIMVRSMVAIAAAGGTTLELCCLGVPALLVAASANQIPVAEAAARSGVAVNLGWHADVTSDRLLTELRSLLGNPDRRADIARAGRALVDGEGPGRVARVVLGDEYDGVEAR